jgi:hypothetical protein
MRTNGCVVEMRCGNQTTAPYADIERERGEVLGGSSAKEVTPVASSSKSNNSGGAIVGAEVHSDILSPAKSAAGQVISYDITDTRLSRQLTGHKSHHISIRHLNTSSLNACYTAPFVRCGGYLNEWMNFTLSPYTPLWNLHVHSKHTEKFRSVPCECLTA